MSNYSYVAVDRQGDVARGTLDVADQSEALRRIREMGLFPTKVLENRAKKTPGMAAKRAAQGRTRPAFTLDGLGGRVKPRRLMVFTRQLATLVDAGMPLLRGLRTLQEQEENRAMKELIEEVSVAIENGSSLGEAVSMHPKVFNGLYVNMVKAGELGGALDVTLTRLAEYMEKARKIKGKVKAAMAYPCMVIFVATVIVMLLMTYVVPRIQTVLRDVSGTAELPHFTSFVFGVSGALTRHLPALLAGAVVLGLLATIALKTKPGRWGLDQIKLRLPVFGKLFKKLAISRFSRTLGTLVSSGVPILQALTIVRETAGNLVVGRVLGAVHDNVKQGESLAPTLRASGVFPVMVAGMVDVGEQTGALPEMLMKIADNYDNEIEDSVGAITSLLEPVLIVFLAVIVGSIVIAVFLPLIPGDNGPFTPNSE